MVSPTSPANGTPASHSVFASKNVSSSNLAMRNALNHNPQLPPSAVNQNGASNDSSEGWSPTSWSDKSMKQEAIYDDAHAVKQAMAQLEHLPPLVTPSEICRLKDNLRDVAQGKSFLLQGGDCAELFEYCEAETISSKVKLLLQMSLILISALNKPVVRIARMAGQYAKPRSKPTEKAEDGSEINAFRGDILNGYEKDERALDPNRMVMAYFHSAATLNYLRAQISSGIADLHRPFDWTLGSVQDKKLEDRYQHVVSDITNSLRFLKTIGADTAGPLKTVDLFTSHEALLLEYEQSLLRRSRHPETGREGWYATSAHFIWIGDRTRQLDHAHVEFFRGLENPIGVKIGPSMEAAELTKLLDIIDPHNEPGKVTLITRYGENKIRGKLGEHIEAVRQTKHVVVWQCDPMHGNTITLADGTKTRKFSSVLSEVTSAVSIHKEHGSILGGVHLELTGDAVTECTGGSEGLSESDLKQRYTTFCDPRLNEKQALELAFLLAELYPAEEQ